MTATSGSCSSTTSVPSPIPADGVAGVTQEAVRPGEELTYRFVAKQAGSYWYHSHQVSHEQVIGGLLGPLVVRPRHRDAAGTDVMALLHTYDGTATVNAKLFRLGAAGGLGLHRQIRFGIHRRSEILMPHHPIVHFL